MKLLLMKVGAKWCGPCQDLARRRTLELLVERHPDVRIEVHDDSEKGSASWDRFAEAWNVKSMPTLIWVYDGKELLRSTNTSASDLELQYVRARKKADAL